MTDTHEELVRKLAHTQPDWPNVLARIKPEDIKHWRQGIRKGNDHIISGRVGEFHLRESLERIAKTTPHITLNPVRDGMLAGPYVFCDNGQLYVRNGGLNRAEYDAIALVEGVPTVFEIKNRICHTIEESFFSDENIERIMKPLQVLYNTDKTAFVCICPVDKLSQVNQRFIAKGGMIVPFYTNPITFRQDVIYRVSKHLPELQFTNATARMRAVAV